ncbi:MAG: FtsW/RodA/SpoVE family cell cycle protein [Candidatus Aegiribacteria sp.]|nr:FtsW/RodA/SpoVE family cell cycle protein [Candidatus Aegiribacteria sp.]
MTNINPFGARNIMLVSAVLLLILGTLAVFTASSFKSLMLTNSESSTVFLLPHIKKVLFGILAGVLAWIIPPGKLKKTAPILYVLSVAMLILLLLLKGTHWAPVINGSARWLVLFGGFRIMPSEIARIAYVILAASLVSDGVIRARTGAGVVWLTVLALIPAALVAFQPDFAGGMYILLVMITVLFLAESRFRDMVVLFLLMLAMASLVVFSSEYRRDRLVSWFSPGDAAEASVYQPEQACIALGSGGIMGRGIGRGRQQRGYLPEAFSDYILAVIGEETGFAGVLLILTLLLLLLLSGWSIAENADHLFGYLVAGGLISSIALGVFIHIAVVTRMFPSTGMPLPLISWGGSNLMVTIGALGIVSRVASEGVR